jgi:flagellar biosynthesis/type III secretory pathway protein FliH
MDDTETLNPRIHLRKPIAGLNVAYYGPEPISFAESQKREKDSYERGRRDSENVCQRQIMQARKEMEQLQNQVLSSVQSRYKELSDQLDENLPDLVLSIVNKVWDGLVLDREAVLRSIDAALSQAGVDTHDMILNLSAQDAALLQNTETFKTRFPNLTVQTDPELKSGDVVVSSRFGIVDSRIKTKIRRVEEEIKKAHQ